MPDLTPRAQEEAAARREREAAALRANLRRRKAQLRAREADAEMPTVLISDGFRFFFSRKPNEPPHVHVKRAEFTAKIWLEPIRVARNYGYPDRELDEVLRVVTIHQQKCLETWHDFFSE